MTSTRIASSSRSGSGGKRVRQFRARGEIANVAAALGQPGLHAVRFDLGDGAEIGEMLVDQGLFLQPKGHDAEGDDPRRQRQEKRDQRRPRPGADPAGRGGRLLPTCP